MDWPIKVRRLFVEVCGKDENFLDRKGKKDKIVKKVNKRPVAGFSVLSWLFALLSGGRNASEHLNERGSRTE